MNVKCYKTSHYYGYARINSIAYNVVDRGFYWLNAIMDKDDGFGNPVGKVITLGGLVNNERVDALYIHGGRESIVRWLRNQDPDVSIQRKAGNDALWLYYFRKHRILGKDTTLVMITPEQPRELKDIDREDQPWVGPDPINLKDCPGTNAVCRVPPPLLATILERMFAGVALAA